MVKKLRFCLPEIRSQSLFHRDAGTECFCKSYTTAPAHSISLHLPLEKGELTQLCASNSALAPGISSWSWHPIQHCCCGTAQSLQDAHLMLSKCPKPDPEVPTMPALAPPCSCVMAPPGQPASLTRQHSPRVQCRYITTFPRTSRMGNSRHS